MLPSDKIKKLEQLVDLYKNNVLSKEEFEREKAKITNSVPGTQPDFVDKNNVDTNFTNEEKTNSPSDTIYEWLISHHVIDCSKRNSVLILIAILLIIGGIIFLSIYNNKYERALDKIEEIGGRILADEEENNTHQIIYSTDDGLYFWNTEEKSAKKLFSNLDSLVVISPYIDRTTCEVMFDKNPYPDSIYIDTRELGFISTDNILSTSYIHHEIDDNLQIEPDMFRVFWPWILIGKHYISHVHSPNQLYDISSYHTSAEFNGLLDLYEKSDVKQPHSVEFDSNGTLKFTLGEWPSALSGYTAYKPTLIDHQSLNYMFYIDRGLYSDFINYFDDYNKAFEKIKILLPVEHFFIGLLHLIKIMSVWSMMK